MLKITSLNLNGIRAAYRKGMQYWLTQENPDIVLMQEVRANDKVIEELINSNWNVVACHCDIKGRAGVAIMSRFPLENVVSSLEEEQPVDTGRWIEANVQTPKGKSLRLACAYLHAGEINTIKMQQKYAHLDKVTKRLQQLYDYNKKTGNPVLVCGDFNIVRSEQDIKNWKPNHNKSAGVMDEEIAYLNKWFDSGWTDITRSFYPNLQGPYTWWSWRGNAYNNDAGWRIDYQIGLGEVVSCVQDVTVYKPGEYIERFSDHAPLTITYDL